MSLLGPVGGSLFLYFAAGAAALAIGAYIIKMRRRRFEVPFSHLWRRVLDQKDSNALWKQLKRLLSLLLMLLILGLVLFAALDPTLGAVDREARNVVILIDASASMKTMDGDEAGKISRMEAAKRKAGELVDSMGGGDLAMIMRVDGQATPLSRFSSDGPMLQDHLRRRRRRARREDRRARQVGEGEREQRADPGAARSDRDAARHPGKRHAGGPHACARGGRGCAARSAQSADRAGLRRRVSRAAARARELGSEGAGRAHRCEVEGGVGREEPRGGRSVEDGRPLPAGRSPQRQRRHHRVQRPALHREQGGVRGLHRGPELRHRAGAPPARALQRLDRVDIKKLDLKPGQRIKQIYSKLPGSIDNELRAQLRQLDGPGGSDAFALDDTAYALLPARKKQKVLMVTEDNLFLEGALLVYDNINPTKLTPADYEKDPTIAERVDVVIFDEYTPKAIPPPPTSLMFFHPTGDTSPFATTGSITDPHITEIDEGHPVMRWVTMSDVYMDKSAVFAIDPKKGETAVAYSVRAPIIAAKRDSRRKILAFGFSLPSTGREGATDLPMRVAFPMLLVNALDWFAGDQTDLLTTYPTGTRERVPLDGVVGATEAQVKGPDGTLTRTPVIEGLATFYGPHVGFYTLAAKNPAGGTVAEIQLAANLASPGESEIAPSSELSLGGKKLEAPEAFAISHSRKIWIYLIFVAMALIVMEWITYHRRITV